MIAGAVRSGFDLFDAGGDFLEACPEDGDDVVAIIVIEIVIRVEIVAQSGNPSYRDQARTTAHPTRACYRVVTLETRSPSSGAPRSSQTKNATEILGLNPATSKARDPTVFIAEALPFND